MNADDERKELYERKELIEQLIMDANKFTRSVLKVIDVYGFFNCDIELLKKLHNSHEAVFNVLDEIFANTLATDAKEKL